MRILNPSLILPWSSYFDNDLEFDGVATVAGLVPAASVYTLTRDLNARDVTIKSGVTVRGQGFVLSCRGLTIEAGGIYGCYGNNASGTVAGGAFSAVGTLGCTAAVGATGRTTTGAGAGGSGSGSNNVCGNGSGNGGAAGAQAGGAGNTTTSPAATAGSFRSLNFAFQRRLFGAGAANSTGGAGAGGCDITAGSASSGGGGSSAPGLLLLCENLNNLGSILSVGGNGGNATGTTGVSGGGGSGGGSYVAIFTKVVINEGTVSSSGGTPGTGYNGGLSGISGASGVTYIIKAV